MTTPTTPRTIADLDRSPREALAAVTATARRPYRPSPEEVARQAAAMARLAEHAAETGLTPEAYSKAGGRKTDKHWLRDLDPDSACAVPGSSCPSCLPAGSPDWRTAA